MVKATIKIHLEGGKKINKEIVVGHERPGADQQLEQMIRQEHMTIMTTGYQYETKDEIITIPPREIERITTKKDWLAG